VHVTDEKLRVTEEKLRVTSDNFLTRVERLHALEEQKREMPSSELTDIAHEIEELTREILEWASRQSELAEGAAKLPEGEDRPIAIVPPRALGIVLSEWRAAERALEGEEPGTAKWESGRADIERLRDEYARAYARTRDRSVS
jgi:hypothetical protein